MSRELFIVLDRFVQERISRAQYRLQDYSGEIKREMFYQKHLNKVHGHLACRESPAPSQEKRKKGISGEMERLGSKIRFVDRRKAFGRTRWGYMRNGITHSQQIDMAISNLFVWLVGLMAS